MISSGNFSNMLLGEFVLDPRNFGKELAGIDEECFALASAIAFVDFALRHKPKADRYLSGKKELWRTGNSAVN